MLRLARAGRAVVVADVNAAGRRALADELTEPGVPGGALGSLHTLVNRAGVLRDRSLQKMSDEDWTRVINVNLRGTLLGCQAA